MGRRLRQARLSGSPLEGRLCVTVALFPEASKQRRVQKSTVKGGHIFSKSCVHFRVCVTECAFKCVTACDCIFEASEQLTVGGAARIAPPLTTSADTFRCTARSALPLRHRPVRPGAPPPPGPAGRSAAAQETSSSPPTTAPGPPETAGECRRLSARRCWLDGIPGVSEPPGRHATPRHSSALRTGSSCVSREMEGRRSRTRAAAPAETVPGPISAPHLIGGRGVTSAAVITR